MWLKQFMLSWTIQIWIWNLNHREFKILDQFWRWNHTKTMLQLIVINFSNLLPLQCFVRARLHTVCFLFIIFSVFWILFQFFLHFSSNTSIYSDPEFYNLFLTKLIFINKLSQNNLKKLKLELKTVLINFKDTIEWMYRNLYGSSTQVWTQM